MLFNPLVNRPLIKMVASVSVTDNVGTIYTFSGVNFGSPFSSRVLIACIALRGAAASAMDQITCTIGGVSATGNDDGEFRASGPSIGAGIWAAEVPSGSSGDVVVDWTGQVGTHRSLVLLSARRIDATPFDQQAPGGGGAGGTSRTDTLDIPANGILVVAASHSNENNTTLVGVDEKTEISVGVGRLAVGYNTRMPAETGRTITASWSTTAARGLRIASFSPV